MPERRRIRVGGTVQGVGFRPFVHRAAVALGLDGFVRNDGAGVLVEAEGTAAALDELGRLLAAAPPPMARVTSVRAVVLPDRRGPTGFTIGPSTGSGGAPGAAVSVDTATCDACLAEVADPVDRRHRYPFTSCTDCGPRYTIVTGVPYDRPRTTMARFTMCERCQAEYDDPTDRRFHAQPNACPACGPRLRLSPPGGGTMASGDEALRGAAAALAGGATVAVKGLGGFHLAADATDAAAVALLRRRKARDDKPFAVAVADLTTARELCDLDEAAAAALASPSRPIVLAPRRTDARVAPGVAPGLPDLGLLLPYTALHHLLLAEVGRPLVLTSGNVSDEPIVHTDDEALARLGPLCDAVLTHDRRIHIRCDDSVVRATGGGIQVLRRSRGMVPEPMVLPRVAHRPLLAVGAELKSTVTVARGSTLTVSHHIGDLEHLAAHQSFVQAIDHLCHLAGVRPEVVAHDLHPEYLSTKLAAELDLPSVAVQHHHAHVASCLAEHGRPGPVLGIAFDGTGLGPDGTLWGGELLVADLDAYERVGHLAPVPLPGGAAAVREPWRTALSWALLALGPDAAHQVGAAMVGDPERVAAVISVAASGRSPTTTSAGRLFDAVAALVGVRTHVTYEAQAAIGLEALARRCARPPAYPLDQREDDGVVVLDAAPLIATVVAERRAGTPPAEIAAGFHEGLGRATARAATELTGRHGLSCVVLTGGVFQNTRLAATVAGALGAAGLEVLTHHRIPCNDGGISVGQAAVASGIM
jgi:hydrogenase maturation protein HypF